MSSPTDSVHLPASPLSYPREPTNQQYVQYVYPGIPPDVFQQVMSYIETSEHQKAEMWCRLQQRTQTEQTLVVLSGKTCVWDGRNHPKELVNCTFTHVLLVKPQPPLHGEMFFLVQASVSEVPMRIAEDDFFRDARLITELHSHPEVKVTMIGSQKKTAAQLRLAIVEHLNLVDLRAYAGWQTCGGTPWFCLFSNLSTHQGTGEMLPPASMRDQSSDFSAVAATSAKQFWPVFRLITSQYARQMVVLWFYTAQLHTLLCELGFEMPMALYIFSADYDLLTYLQQVFGWYGDQVISPDSAGNNFASALLNRRDQPLLLVDEGYSKRAFENIRTLENVLADRHVVWKSDRDVLSLPLQALPTIISSQISSLCCAPQSIVLDMDSKSFDWSKWVDMYETVSSHSEHRACFTRYTEIHVAELHTALMDGQRTAIRMSHGQLNENCKQALGILFGMWIFLQQFFRFCAPAIPPIRLDDATATAALFNLMKQATEKEYAASLPGQFIYVAGQHIRKGLLRLCSRMQASDAANVVYAEEERLHFTAPAFCTVCKAMHQSRPVILRALAAEGMLCGAQTNPGTAQTRIHVYHENGKLEQIPVYSVDRARFEELGDPLIVEGGDT